MPVHQSDQPGKAGQPAPLVYAAPAALGQVHAEILGHAWPGQAAAESPMVYMGPMPGRRRFRPR